MDRVTGQCPQTTTFLKRKESRSGIEPRSFHLPATVVARKEYLNNQRLKGVSLVLVVVVKNYLTDRPTDINLPAKQSGISTLT